MEEDKKDNETQGEEEKPTTEDTGEGSEQEWKWEERETIS